MRQGQRTTFTKKPTLYRMLNLRLAGLTYTTLANMFGVDWTTIRYWAHKYQIAPAEVVGLEPIIAQVVPRPAPPTYKVVNGERINLGRSYREYFSP